VSEVKRWRMSDMPLSEYGLYTEVVLASEYDTLKLVLEAVRSQMCWERDRDQLSMGFKDLHDAVTEVLGKDEI